MDIWDIKWFNGTLSESCFLLNYMNLVYLMYSNEKSEEKSGTHPEIDEYSHECKSEDFKIIELN